MNENTIIQKARQQGITASLLKSLWLEAGKIGDTFIFTMDDGMFAKIVFKTPTGINIEAISNFNCDTPEQALIEAIDKANEIKRSFK